MLAFVYINLKEASQYWINVYDANWFAGSENGHMHIVALVLTFQNSVLFWI